MKLFSTFIMAFFVSILTITAFAKFPQHIVRPADNNVAPAGYHSSQAPYGSVPANAQAGWNKSQRAAAGNKSYWHNNHWHNSYQSYQHHKHHTDRLSKNQAHRHIDQMPNQ